MLSHPLYSAQNRRKSALTFAPIRSFSLKVIGIGASADGRLTMFGALSAQLGANSEVQLPSFRENVAPTGGLDG